MNKNAKLLFQNREGIRCLFQIENTSVVGQKIEKTTSAGINQEDLHCLFKIDCFLRCLIVLLWGLPWLLAPDLASSRPAIKIIFFTDRGSFL